MRSPPLGAGNVGFTGASSFAGTAQVVADGTLSFGSTSSFAGNTLLDVLGNISFGGAATFAGRAQVLSLGNVGFGAAVHGPGSLFVNTPGVTSFAANIGATTPLDSLWIDNGSVVLPSLIRTNGANGNFQAGQVFFSDITLGAGSITFDAAPNQFVFMPNLGNNFGGSPVTVTNSSVTLIRDGALQQFVIGAGGMTASNSILLDVTQFKDTPVSSVAEAAALGGTGPNLAPTLNAPFVGLRFRVDYPSPPQLRDATNFTIVALYNLGPSVAGLEVRPPSVEADMGVPSPRADMVEGYRFFFTGQVPAGGGLSFTDPDGVLQSASSISFRNVDLRVNNVGVNPAFDGPDVALTSAITAAQAAAAQAAQEEAKKSFGTDSVAKQIDFGFAGDVGTSPPMNHRILLNGISTPACFDESREGQACK